MMEPRVLVALLEIDGVIISTLRVTITSEVEEVVNERDEVSVRDVMPEVDVTEAVVELRASEEVVTDIFEFVILEDEVLVVDGNVTVMLGFPDPDPPVLPAYG